LQPFLESWLVSHESLEELEGMLLVH
jgi:hypothetical protein